MKKVIFLAIALLGGCVSTPLSNDTPSFDRNLNTVYNGSVPNFRYVKINIHEDALFPPSKKDYLLDPLGLKYTSIHEPYITSLTYYSDYLDRYIRDYVDWGLLNGLEIAVPSLGEDCERFEWDIKSFGKKPKKPDLSKVNSKTKAYEIYKKYAEDLDEFILESRDTFIGLKLDWETKCRR